MADKGQRRNRCVYRLCPSTVSKDISSFTFPRDPNRARLWLESCDRLDLEGKKLHRVYNLCEKHFDKKFIKNRGKQRRLTKNAIPTIFPLLEYEDITKDLPLTRILIQTATPTLSSTDTNLSANHRKQSTFDDENTTPVNDNSEDNNDPLTDSTDSSTHSETFQNHLPLARILKKTAIPTLKFRTTNLLANERKQNISDDENTIPVNDNNGEDSTDSLTYSEPCQNKNYEYQEKYEKLLENYNCLHQKYALLRASCDRKNQKIKILQDELKFFRDNYLKLLKKFNKLS